jgi:hypothetical protein
MIMISLVGEQPIPNLLPIRHQSPAAVVLAYTDRTQAAAERLERLLPEDCETIPCHVSPYDIRETIRSLQALIKERSWVAADLLFNLTGGTKAMALAAYIAATDHMASFLYLQSEGRKTRLYRYDFDADGIPRVSTDQLLPGLITIDDYLRAYVDDYWVTGFAKGGPGGSFERAIYDVLEPKVDEIIAGVSLTSELDVDLIVRCENQVGLIEAKTGTKVKKGIDQLNTAGGQRFLGTYTRKMLISDQQWDDTFTNHKDLAKARRVTVVQLPSFGMSQQLSPEDVERLQCAVCQELGREASI